MRIRRLAALLLAAAGCGSASAERWNDVLGAEWKLVRIEERRPLGGTEVSLTFGTGRLYGSAVNRYAARYARSDGTLTIEGVSSTRARADAPPGALEQEATYLRLLGSVDGWSAGADHLDLTCGGVRVLSFARGTAVGARW